MPYSILILCSGERARLFLQDLLGKLELQDVADAQHTWSRVSDLAAAIAEYALTACDYQRFALTRCSVSGHFGDEGYLTLLYNVPSLTKLVSSAVCSQEVIDGSILLLSTAQKALQKPSAPKLTALQLHTKEDKALTKEVLKNSPYVFNFPNLLQCSDCT
jgi:hypothetical protein